MPGDEFFRTRMGQRFYEATMPKIADQLERLNTNIESLVVELRRQKDAVGAAGSVPDRQGNSGADAERDEPRRVPV